MMSYNQQSKASIPLTFLSSGPGQAYREYPRIWQGHKTTPYGLGPGEKMQTPQDMWEGIKARFPRGALRVIRYPCANPTPNTNMKMNSD